MLKQLGIAIGLMIILIILIVVFSKKKESYNASPYQVLDYVTNRNALNSRIPVSARKY